MAGQFTRLQKTYKIMDADGVALYRGVTMTGENECKKPVVENELPLGIVDNDQRLDIPYQASGDQTGRNIAVKLEGIGSIELSGPVAVGDRIILDVGGFAKAVPNVANATPVDYNVLGFAEKSGDIGDVIPVRMQYHIFTK